MLHIKPYWKQITKSYTTSKKTGILFHMLNAKFFSEEHCEINSYISSSVFS